MKIISINKEISLSEGKIALNLDEEINEEILGKLDLSAHGCTLTSADNLKIIYVDVDVDGNLANNFIGLINETMTNIIAKLRYEKEEGERQEQKKRIDMIKKFSKKTNLTIV